MKRDLYRLLLLLHPGEFRRQFREEMLCVFEEADREGRASGYCSSAAWSLLRHWARRPMLWKIAGGLAGGILTLFWGIAATPRRIDRVAPVTVDVLVLATVAVLLAILLIVIFTVSSFRRMQRRM